MNFNPIITHLDDNVRKLFANRQSYITQSANTKNGVVAPFAAPLSELELSPDFEDDSGALSEPMNGDDYSAIAQDEYYKGISQ